MGSKDFEKVYYGTKPLMTFADILIVCHGKAVIKQALREVLEEPSGREWVEISIENKRCFKI